MNTINVTGGARIGRVNASFPFAKLIVKQDVLELKASLVASLVFRPQDIISIEPYTMIPVLGQGIKIKHRVESYKENVIFWTFSDPKALVANIQKTGFLNPEQASSSIADADPSIVKRQKTGGNPFKKHILIPFFIIYNLLFMMDIYKYISHPGEFNMPLGIGIQLGLGLIFGTAFFTLVSEQFRKMVLKEGRTLADVKTGLYFAIFVSGIVFLALTAASYLTA